MRLSLLLPALLLFCGCSQPARSNSPEELGKVRWLRDFETGLERASLEDKPVFLLFQEVPGCATCRNYGNEVLSHPLIVEAIETLFVPVAIFNNKGGKDAEVLRYYNEPSWNNPVVRIVDYGRLDLIPRVSGNYSQLGVVQAMVFALERRSKPIPVYLQLLYEELLARQQGLETTTLSMYCFWTGEKMLGQLDGVIATEAGFMDGREVVQVAYNPKTVSFKEIVEAGQQARCADRVYAHNDAQKAEAIAMLGQGKAGARSSFRPGHEPKYYLSRTPYRFVPMFPLQAARANALIGQGKSPEGVLSPRQAELAKQMKAHPEGKWENVIGKDMIAAWAWEGNR
ncbi:MAG: thioredoxin family protein [Phaeodactylibacter sp.]|nr:thioredoxin family protein [Phaeodactylibacter sp.]MCB9051214.1 thioredoxin family protein [Lewinellaceae bacterium]